MRNEHGELLSQQLELAIAAVAAGQGEAFEVAVLAGLLARHGGHPPVLAEAERWCGAEGRLLLRAALADLSLEDALGGIIDADEHDSEEERADVLFDLDELCAGAHFCAERDQARMIVDLAVSTIRAFPEPWAALAPLATSLLESAPPHEQDPALGLWRAIEALHWAAQPEDDMAPRCDAASRELALPLLLTLPAPRAQLPASADELPPAPRWELVLREDDWELALVTEPSGRSRLELSAVAHVTEVAVQREGTTVPLERPAPGVWSCAAEPGSYEWTINGRRHLLEVMDDRI